METNQQPQSQQIAFPQVDFASVEGFSKKWNHNGINLVLDKTSKQFALDFANVVLRSFCIDNMNRYNAAKAAQEAAIAESDKPKSSLILEA